MALKMSPVAHLTTSAGYPGLLLPGTRSKHSCFGCGNDGRRSNRRKNEKLHLMPRSPSGVRLSCLKIRKRSRSMGPGG